MVGRLTASGFINQIGDMMHSVKKPLPGLALRVLPVVFWGLLATAGAAHAATGSRYIACPGCAPQNLVWNENEFDQVYLVEEASAAGKQHPHTVAVDLVRKTLAALRYQTGGEPMPLLDEESASALAQGIAKAISKASAQQEAIFMVTNRASGGLFGGKLGNSGRAFVDQNGLNIIFGEAHVEFVTPYRATRVERAFDFGSRRRASTVRVSGDGLEQPRPDWVVIPLAASAGNPARAAASPAAVPAPQAAPVRDEQYYAAQEMRLKGLKRLRDQNLINDDEYRSMRSDILKTW